MKATIAGFCSFAICLGSAAKAQQTAPVIPERVTVAVDTTRTSPAVSPYLFGQFTEHIGSIMYSSLWAEMLDDRKFYFPITAESAASPTRQQGGFGMKLRKWQPVGPAEAVVMDKDHPFVGDQSPRIQLDAASPHGIRQAGINLVNGKNYVGRIYLRGTPGAKVQISLIWGSGQGDRQTITVGRLTGDYKKFPLAFTAKAGSADASFEITGTGNGSLSIGTVSLMPSDNIKGFRPDTTSLLHEIKMGFWRYGGNYTSGLIWYHIVGDIDKRPPDFDYAWNAMQPNDLGLDEFMTLCQLIGVDPYISVNAGFGDSHSAAEEVEYMNGAATTYMGSQRARNGHPEPYHVKFWNIGNEPWGNWQLGHMNLKYYMLKHNEFAKAMRKVDPSIVLIASAMMLQNDNVPEVMRSKYVGNLDGLYGSDYDWTGGFLKNSMGYFDILAEHWYASSGHHWDIEKGKALAPDAPADAAYVKIDQNLLEWARYPADTVRLKAEEFEGYQQRFPEMVEKKIPLSIDEYAYFNPSPNGGDGVFSGFPLRQALAYGMILNEMMRYTDFLTMGAQTTGESMIEVNPTGSTLSALGLLYKMYGETFPGAMPVALVGNSPQPAPKYPSGSPDQPAKSSGSPTYPLDIVAALSADRKYLVLSVVNATESEQKFDLDLGGLRLSASAKLIQLTGSSPLAANHAGKPPELEIKETAVDTTSMTVSVAPISVNIYRFPIAE